MFQLLGEEEEERRRRRRRRTGPEHLPEQKEPRAARRGSCVQIPLSVTSYRGSYEPIALGQLCRHRRRERRTSDGWTICRLGDALKRKSTRVSLRVIVPSVVMFRRTNHSAWLYNVR